MLSVHLEGGRRVIAAGLLIAVIALIDWRVDPPISFGFLYLLPVILVGSLGRWHVLITAVAGTLLADLFDPFPFILSVSLPQDLLVFTALAGTGLFTHEVSRSRRREMESYRRLEKEAGARRAAEEQLEFLIDSSPAAILTMASDGRILLANSAAHRLFAVPAGGLPGRNVSRYVAALGYVPSIDQTPQTFRTEMQCRGERENGDVFLANVFFSTYRTAMGPRLAALLVDASEDLREREESSLEQLLSGSRILMGAVSHEVRNVCGAIAVIYENLVRDGALGGNQDFEALGALVETLNRIASLELKQSAGHSQAAGADLFEILDDLGIVLDPYCKEAEIALHWEIPEQLPPVWADRHSLLQVLLNLTKNSQQALENAAEKRIDISVSVSPPTVAIRITDSGPGIGSTEHLFQPFQRGAGSTGLGLFLSRAFVRSFRGDLRHDPTRPGCSFVLELAIAGSGEMNHARGGKRETNTPAAAR